MRTSVLCGGFWYTKTMKPRLYIDQKITAFVNKYKVYGVDASGEKSELVALAQQKRLAFKEKVWFYNDEAKTKEVFSFRAEKVMDVHGRYFVEDTDGAVVGAYRKQTLFRDHYQLSTTDDAHEALDWRVFAAIGVALDALQSR